MTISSCPICTCRHTAQVSSIDRKGRPLTTVLCESCGHVYNDPIPSNAELEIFYRKEYRLQYKGTARPRLRQIDRNFSGAFNFIEKWSEILQDRQNIMDIGCGSGEFLFLMHRRGFNVRGIEPNSAYAYYCKDELGLNVEGYVLNEISSQKEVFDFIRLSHVLEHCPSPSETLGQISKMLSNDGILFVEVPNIESYCKYKSRGGMFHYGHISNFSPWTLRAIAHQSGLEELEYCRSTQANTTSTFFRKGYVNNYNNALNRANAIRVKAALDAHEFQKHSLQDITHKLTRKGLLRTQETLRAIIAFGSPCRIGERYAHRLNISPSKIKTGITI